MEQYGERLQQQLSQIPDNIPDTQRSPGVYLLEHQQPPQNLNESHAGKIPRQKRPSIQKTVDECLPYYMLSSGGGASRVSLKTPQFNTCTICQTFEPLSAQRFSGCL